MNGNILNVKDGYIFHQTNCQGAMGSGLAKQIRQQFPKVYEEYKSLCSLSKKPWMLLGNAQVVPVSDQLSIVNVFGQLDFGRDGKRYTDYGALSKAFRSFTMFYDKNKSVNFPYLFGCGLGGGDWNIVEDMINSYFTNPIIWKL